MSDRSEAPGSTRRSTADERFLDRKGIPHVLRWGFLGVLVFMTGNGVESNFLEPHVTAAIPGDRASLAATIITVYGISVLVGSYLSGALSDLFGPRRIMLLGFVVWVGFELLFLLSLRIESVPLIFLTYFLRGFGYPLFAFSFLVWVNHVAPYERNGTAVGWFYVMFTGGLPTLGSLFAVFAIPAFGGGFGGERATMAASTAIVAAGFLIAWFGVREGHGSRRLAPRDESTSAVVFSGLTLTARNPKILQGFLVRLINTAPQFGMFIVLPVVIADDRGWGQSRWLIMTVVVYASNILVNAVFGAIGDKVGWIRTVRWFGILGSALGLLAWWYVPQLVPAGSTWGYYASLAAGVSFGVMLAGFVPMGAIMPALAPHHKGAAMAMYTTAAGGAAFVGSAVVAVVRPWGGNVGTHGVGVRRALRRRVRHDRQALGAGARPRPRDGRTPLSVAGRCASSSPTLTPTPKVENGGAMSTPSPQTTSTAAFYAQAGIAFGVSLAGAVVGIAYLPIDAWQRAFLAMTLLFVVTSAFTLAKVVRDRQEVSTVRVRVDEARMEKLIAEHDPFKIS